MRVPGRAVVAGLVVGLTATWAPAPASAEPPAVTFTLEVPNALSQVMTPDARFIAFDSYDPFVADDTNGRADVYVLDRQTHVYERVSVDSDEMQRDGLYNAYVHDISDDGRYVLFGSRGVTYVSEPFINGRHYWVRDRAAGTTELVDVTLDGTEASNSNMSAGAISGDGRRVAFFTRSTQLVPGVPPPSTSSGGYLYVRDRQTATTTLASAKESGQAATAGIRMDWSSDGRYLVFTSDESLIPTSYIPPADPENEEGTYIPGDGNSSTDVYRRDVVSGELDLVSTRADGYAFGSARLLGVSADGTEVLASTASAYYLWDLGAGARTEVPLPPQVNIGSLAGGGSRFWYGRASGTSTYVLGALDLATGESHDLAELTGAPEGISSSHDGRFASFETDVAPVAGAPAGTNVYVADLPVSAPNPDGDGDGVDDVIGTGAGAFSDPQVAPQPATTGSIVEVPTGLSVRIVDAADPDGVQVTVSGSAGPTDRVTLSVCGFTVKLTTGSNVVLTCGSLVAKVITGEAVVDLGEGATVTVPSGVEARISQSAAGGYDVEAVIGDVTITVDGTSATIQQGTTSPLQNWHFTGFAAPIDNLPSVNSVQGGRALPVKWRLTYPDGSPVMTLSSAQVRFASVDCTTNAPIDEIEQTAAGSSGLQNLGDGYYQLNWKTPKSIGCGELRLDIGQGVIRSALLRLR